MKRIDITKVDKRTDIIEKHNPLINFVGKYYSYVQEFLIRILR